MTLPAKQTIVMDQEDILCFSGCWKEQNLHASMLREWHSWFWAGLGLCVMTSLCVLGQVCSRSCPCLALTCHRAGAAPASFTTSLPACLLTSPLWLPKALNHALCRQCICVGYVHCSSELGLYQTYTSAHPFDTLVTVMEWPYDVWRFGFIYICQFAKLLTLCNLQ